jgi:hypothetical protein
VQLGAGRTPLIIAGIAALVTYAAFGSGTPFGLLHHFSKSHHPHSVSIAIDTDDKPASPGTPEANLITRDLPAFDSIVLEDGAAASITIGDTQSVGLTAPGGHGEGVKTEVHDGKLVVGGMGPAVHLILTVPHLRDIQVNGPSKVSIEGLREPISVTANGPAHLSASGSVESADLTVNGPSKLAFAELVAKNVQVHLNGLGDAEVNATQNLTADVEGVGRVRYMGQPHVVSTIHGTGSIKRLADAG